MPINIEGWKTRIATGYARIFGGRMARATFALRAAILIGVIYITAAPISTILASSTKTLRDAYGVAVFMGRNGAMTRVPFCKVLRNRVVRPGRERITRPMPAIELVVGFPAHSAHGVLTFDDVQRALYDALSLDRVGFIDYNQAEQGHHVMVVLWDAGEHVQVRE